MRKKVLIMERLILHSDLNCFYASVECLLNPSYRDRPVAVCGDPGKRHGIVVAKNYIAKAFGVNTGDTVWQAKKKCPDLALFPVRFDKYKYYSEMARRIYYEYTNLVEPYGLDEAWLDISRRDGDYEYAFKAAEEISGRIKNELGLTVSIGVSFTKSFAKLGSDYKKPDAITVITPDNYKKIAWPLGVSNLIYVGKATEKTLSSLGIHTIGDLAAADEGTIKNRLGKNGERLRLWANGADNDPVRDYMDRPTAKSIGNSVTLPYDITSDEDISVVLMALAEKIASRLREKRLMCSSVQIDIKGRELTTATVRKKLSYPTCVAGDIYNAAVELIKTKRRRPVRALGIRVESLESSDMVQLSLEADFARSMKQLKLEEALDGIRKKYGNGSVKRGIMLLNSDLSELGASSAGGDASAETPYLI